MKRQALAQWSTDVVETGDWRLETEEVPSGRFLSAVTSKYGQGEYAVLVRVNFSERARCVWHD